MARPRVILVPMRRWRTDDTDPSMPRALQWALVASLAPAFGLGWWLGAWGERSQDLFPREAVSRVTAAKIAQAEPEPSAPAPPLIAVAEHYRLDPQHPDGPPTDRLAYPLLPASAVFAWPTGNDDGGLESGIGMMLLTDLVRDFEGDGRASQVALLNPVAHLGFTDLVLYLFDANGLIEYVCLNLNERQMAYIDFHTWGFVSEGYRGHAVISAFFWEHDVFEGDPLAFQRNMLGLGATVVERETIDDGTDRLSSARWAIPMDIHRNWELQDTLVVSLPLLCGRGGGGRFRGPTRTPNPAHSPTPRPTATTSPSPTSTATPWPTPRSPVSVVERAPALRFPAAARGGTAGAGPGPAPGGSSASEGSEALDCASELILYNPGLRPAQAILVAQPTLRGEGGGDEVGGGGQPADCGRDFEVVCTGLIAPHTQWRWPLPERLANGAALTVLSVDRRSVRSSGFDAAGTFAGVLCATLERQLDEGCLPWPEVLEAWRNGLAYSPHPEEPGGPALIPISPGSPLLGEVRRTCDGESVAVLARADTDLGWSPDAPGEDDAPRSWIYGLPLPSILAGGGLEDDGADSAATAPTPRLVAQVMAATGIDGAVEVSWLREVDGEARACGVWDVPGGASLMLDLTDCWMAGLSEASAVEGAPTEPGSGALHFASSVPLATMVDADAVADPATSGAALDGRRSRLWTSLPAAPLVHEDPQVRPPLGAADGAAFAPMLYYGYRGWHSRLRVHNPDPRRPTGVRVTILDRSGDTVAMRDVPWVPAGGSFGLELHDLLAPPEREGEAVLQARVERLPGRAVTPTPPGPRTPTATPTLAPLLWLPRLEGRQR